MTHTPGPWTFRAQGEANEYCLMTADGRWLLAFLHNGEEWTAKQVANARLIAAAPDLLAALKDMETARHNGFDLPWGTVSQAIKKAEDPD